MINMVLLAIFALIFLLPWTGPAVGAIGLRFGPASANGNNLSQIFGWVSSLVHWAGGLFTLSSITPWATALSLAISFTRGQANPNSITARAILFRLISVPLEHAANTLPQLAPLLVIAASGAYLQARARASSTTDGPYRRARRVLDGILRDAGRILNAPCRPNKLVQDEQRVARVTPSARAARLASAAGPGTERQAADIRPVGGNSPSSIGLASVEASAFSAQDADHLAELASSSTPSSGDKSADGFQVSTGTREMAPLVTGAGFDWIDLELEGTPVAAEAQVEGYQIDPATSARSDGVAVVADNEDCASDSASEYSTNEDEGDNNLEPYLDQLEVVAESISSNEIRLPAGAIVSDDRRARSGPCIARTFGVWPSRSALRTPDVRARCGRAAARTVTFKPNVEAVLVASPEDDPYRAPAEDLTWSAQDEVDCRAASWAEMTERECTARKASNNWAAFAVACRCLSIKPDYIVKDEQIEAKMGLPPAAMFLGFAQAAAAGKFTEWCFARDDAEWQRKQLESSGEMVGVEAENPELPNLASDAGFRADDDTDFDEEVDASVLAWFLGFDLNKLTSSLESDGSVVPALIDTSSDESAELGELETPSSSPSAAIVTFDFIKTEVEKAPVVPGQEIKTGFNYISPIVRIHTARAATPVVIQPKVADAERLARIAKVDATLRERVAQIATQVGVGSAAEWAEKGLTWPAQSMQVVDSDEESDVDDDDDSLAYEEDREGPFSLDLASKEEYDEYEMEEDSEDESDDEEDLDGVDGDQFEFDC